jgi:hypothetical protein
MTAPVSLNGFHMNKTFEKINEIENSEYAKIFLDEIVNKTASGWPSLFDVVDCRDCVRDILKESDFNWIFLQGRRLKSLEKADRMSTVRAVELAEPGMFGRIVGLLYALYYAAPSVAAKLRRLAERGEEDSAALFDRALVAQVITTGAGRRRL